MKPAASTLRGLALAVGVQALLALGLTLPHMVAMQGAKVVRLQTVPADPRDTLRGHYLTLGYAFSNVTPPNTDRGQTVYLPLQEGKNGLWEGGAAQLTRPEGGLYLRGKVVWNYSGRGRVSYGIERFYLEEDAALAEDARRGTGARPLVARVQVGHGGEAQVVSVERDGVAVK